MTKEYAPRGKVVPLLQAMEENPDRCWSLQEAAVLLKTPKNGVMSMVTYALRAGVIHRGRDTSGGGVILRKTPFAPGEALPAPGKIENHGRRAKTHGAWTPEAGDIRIPRVVAGWVPPVMTPPRSLA